MIVYIFGLYMIDLGNIIFFMEVMIGFREFGIWLIWKSIRVTNLDVNVIFGLGVSWK
jgi:hypothetical protein